MSNAGRIGKTAFIRYIGGAKGEEPVDDRSSGEPLPVVLGNMQLPRGIEDAIFDMEVGEHRTIVVPCEKAYGEYQEKLVNWYPKSMVADGYSLKVGDVIFWPDPADGCKMPVWVTDQTKDALKLDFNHPFAGKALAYRLELVDLK